jgi:hypothetical protein
MREYAFNAAHKNKVLPKDAFFTIKEINIATANVFAA